MKRLLFGTTLALVLSVIPLAAAKPPTESSVIILNTPAGLSASTDWQPHLGDSITFTVTYPKTLDHFGVRIQVLCYQDGNLVYGMAGPYNYVFVLGGGMSQWYLNDGPATCHADLYYWSYNGGQKYNQLAWTEFSAQGRQ